jgi:hypothetical protein
VNKRITAIDNTANLTQFFRLRPARQYLFSLAEYHTFTPSLTNEFRVGYIRYNDKIPVTTPPYPGLNRFPNITIDNDLGIQIGPTPNGPHATMINTYALVNIVSCTRASHNLKFGFDGRDLIAPQ